MVSGTDDFVGQTDFLDANTSPNTSAQFAEVCNALYERELRYLAIYGPNHIQLLKRKLKGLSYHIRRAADVLTSERSPLALDPHNASWQAKQLSQCPAHSQSESDRTWFFKHAIHGLVVPILIEEMGTRTIELDSVDRVKVDNETLHVNKHGWFHFTGEQHIDARSTYKTKRLLKPNKKTMTAACCGHMWNHKGKINQRALTLRESLLSGNINWKTFAIPASKRDR